MHGPEQIEDRAEQREQQVAQCRRQRLGAAVEADQRHRGKCQQFEGDIKIEQIARRERPRSSLPKRASSNVQKTSGARASGFPAASEIALGRTARWRDISSAAVTIIAAENPSARNATPSGGCQPPTTYCNTSGRARRRRRSATATASPTGITDQRDTLGIAPAEEQRQQQPATGKTIARTSRNPPAVVPTDRTAGIGISRVFGPERAAAGRHAACIAWLRKSRSSKRHRQRRRRKGDDDAGDDQRLRHRIAAEPGRGTSAGDDPEQQEHAAAEQIEGEDLAQRLRMHDQAV